MKIAITVWNSETTSYETIKAYASKFDFVKIKTYEFLHFEDDNKITHLYKVKDILEIELLDK